MKFEKILSVAFVLVVIVVTGGLVFFHDPETVALQSGDGVMSVSGVARQPQAFKIVTNESLGEPLVGLVYEVSPEQIILDQPITISFNLTAEQRDQDLGVYYFDPALKMWSLVPELDSSQAEVLTFKTKHLGRFSLGRPLELESPVFANKYLELLALAPTNTVGYEIAVGVSVSDKVIVRLEDQGQLGGCNGEFLTGDDLENSQLSQAINTLKDGESVTANFIFTANWLTSKSGSCAEGEILREQT
jgi:hypothetical protein